VTAAAFCRGKHQNMSPLSCTLQGWSCVVLSPCPCLLQVSCPSGTVMCPGGTLMCPGGTVMCPGGTVMCLGGNVMCPGGT